MSKRLILLAIIALIAVAQVSHAVLVSGYCYLENQTNHAGTKVKFVANSPGAVTDSTYTNSTGYYTKNLALGAYDVLFTHDGYFDDAIWDQLFVTPTTLPDVTLIQMIGTPLSGSLSGILSSGVYLVVGDIYVDWGNTLTIEPGTTIYFAGNDSTGYGFQIYGTLQAQGTEQDSILFMPAPNSPWWSGLYIANWDSAGGSSLNYCRISGSNSNGIYCDYYSSLNISNCKIIEHVDRGILCSEYSSVAIENCMIGMNAAEGVYCGYGANISIRNCEIFENSWYGIFCDDYSNVAIDSCLIRDNTYDGVGVDGPNYATTISHCIISGCGGAGIEMWDGSSPIISQCTIVGNGWYWGSGGIYVSSSDPTIVNTVVEGQVSSYGIYFNNSPSAYVTYCDFNNNSYGNFGGSTPSWLGWIVMTNANGDSCDLFYNIFEDPLFADPTNGNFNLTANSPCIDAGDPTSPPDPDNTIADIGAFYFNQGPGGAQPNIELSATSLDFGSVPVGTFDTAPLTIYNTGDTTLVIYSVISSDPVFTTTYQPADSLILAGDSLQITVRFVPAQIAIYGEVLTIQNNDQTAYVNLLGQGIGPVAVTLTPYGAPITVPPGGGAFNFNIEVSNLTSAPQSYDFWTQIELPQTGVVEVLNVPNLTLPAGVSMDRDRTQSVPGLAPAGTYYYNAYVGDYPWVIQDHDWFTFDKAGTNRGGSLGSPADWPCTGEPLISPAETYAIPEVYALHGAHPNPFNAVSTIAFDLPEATQVNLAVYDPTGRMVAKLVDGWREAGSHEVTFDGASLSSGIYFCRLSTGSFGAISKVVLLK
jgi:parallel beta-helix repeat protein